MGKRRRKRKRKCKHCGKMYLPDPRTCDRQKHCSAPECRRASKAWRQRRWYYSEKGAEYRDPAYNKQRVQEWRKYLQRYKPLTVPIRCEFCAHVGEAQWHCHNPKSPQQHINVMPWDVCSKWTPNMGLLMLLRRAWWNGERG